MKPIYKTVYFTIFIVAIIGIVLELIVSAGRTETAFTHPLIRSLNFFTYFTAWMNILAAVTSILLVRNFVSTTLHALRITAISGLAVTMYIQYMYLSSTLNGLPFISDLFIHTIVPALYIIAWLFIGPKIILQKKIFLYSLIIPTIWLGSTLIRGVVTGWYPYEFLDLTLNGVLKTLLNIFILYSMLFVGMLIIFIREHYFR